ncbi:Protein of unknown function (DUF1461) [Spongiibacter sp. IMCC21906]|uniref:lipoprotein intramolecular transacylase Lit n=1 Tax=Spongiibacter sp. IMCC21906 TaxID=1620392 RepID=UPI00062E0436|nr:DUF1461 domain-containing protein [Spongiibacter sp. IMCC21906]AKH68789.1 Protein of unknown function (DUF1461) [Spongiibacter sp. IMCC21906]
MPPPVRLISNALYGLLTLLFVVTLAWAAVASMNYGYGFWHDHGGLAENIEEYGPLNRHRKHFEDTDRQQRISLFAEIVEAVHHGGEGLREIRYQAPGQDYPTALLHRAEIIHLQDVSQLIRLAKSTLAAASGLWLLLTAGALWRKWPLPTVQQQLYGVVLGSLCMAAALLAFGFERVFYQFHIWLFPPEHQWFFYYQESLMSTMMKAPVLFKYIGVSIGILATPLFVGIAVAMKKISRSGL